MADLRFLRHIAAQTGLGINYLSKEEKISFLLRQLSGLFGNEVILKGGTPISRLYLSKAGKGRFSEDLDFDIISKGTFKKKIAYLSGVMDEIEGFDVPMPRLQYKTLRFDCYYINEIEIRDRVMVEFYLGMNDLCAVETPKKELVEPIFVPSQSSLFFVYSLEDLMARKILTLYERTDGKDIYDMFYLLELGYDINKLKKAISLLLKFEDIDLKQDEFSIVMKKRLNGMVLKAKHIGNSTNHFLPTHLRPAWSGFIPSLINRIERDLR